MIFNRMLNMNNPLVEHGGGVQASERRWSASHNLRSTLSMLLTRAHLDTATAGPRTVPVRSGLAGEKTLEFSAPPRPRDVLRAGTARAPVAVSRYALLALSRPLLLALMASVAALCLASCKKGGTDAKPADVDYYTCTMHPSVKKQNPTDKCPICSMDLVPVKKREATASEGPSVETSHVHHAPDAPRSTLHARDEVGAVRESVAQPTEFTVPVARQQQIGVTYATIEKRPFTRAIRAVGVVAYDNQRHWDYASLL